MYLNSNKPMVLIILDGWGHREDNHHNPIKNATIPCMDHLFKNYPWTLLDASGKSVGLPDGQIGNSEVGHLHIGSGREVPQDLTRINDAIANGSFKKNPVLMAAIEHAQKNNRAIHIMGLVSPGGVHSHENHILALMQMISDQGVQQYLHAFLDGRDVPPRSAQASLNKIEGLYQKLKNGQIASIIGRYYAMDRDNRWERTQAAYDLLTAGKAQYTAETAAAGLAAAYARNENDEFVKATAIHAPGEKPHTVKDGDVIIFMNFRADRARQLCFAFTDPHFTGFERSRHVKLDEFITLTEYSEELEVMVAFPPLSFKNTLGEFLANQGLKQLRIAETEKYAHVTYFLNGGNETPFANEDRILIPSPKVATYDLQPEMSAIELTDQLVKAINNGDYDIIICNFANPDMVGHTGVETAANRAIEVVDQCIKKIVDSLQKIGGELLITSDHGNVEMMYDEKNHQPHTAHTTNQVPFLYMGRKAEWRVIAHPSLKDVAPTVLYLLGFKPPQEMTGKILLQLL